MDSRRGFGLVSILIVVAIIALFFGGRFYIKTLQEQKSSVEIGRDAEKRAEEVKRLLEKRGAEAR